MFIGVIKHTAKTLHKMSNILCLTWPVTSQVTPVSNFQLHLKDLVQRYPLSFEFFRHVYWLPRWWGRYPPGHSRARNSPYLSRARVNPSPPGLLAHPECLGGLPRPLKSREPSVVESRARRHSKALHKTHPKLLSELKIEDTCEVKVRSKVKIRRFDVLGPGDQDYRTRWLNFRQNGVKGTVNVWFEWKWHPKKTSRSRSGHKRSLYVRIVIKSYDKCFMTTFRRRTWNSWLKYHLT